MLFRVVKQFVDWHATENAEIDKIIKSDDHYF